MGGKQCMQWKKQSFIKATEIMHLGSSTCVSKTQCKALRKLVTKSIPVSQYPSELTPNV